MSKVTSKFQVTLPKRIAEAYSIRPGDDIEWLPAGETIRVVPPGKHIEAPSRESRLRLFDQATERQRKRSPSRVGAEPRNRGWKREDLYKRGSSR